MAVLYTKLLIYFGIVSTVTCAVNNGPYLYFLPFEMKPLTSPSAEFSVPELQPVNEIKKVQHKFPLEPLQHRPHHKETHVPHIPHVPHVTHVPHTKIIDHQEAEKAHNDNSSISVNELLHALGLDEVTRHGHHKERSSTEDQIPADEDGLERSSYYPTPSLYGPLDAPETKAFLPDRLDIIHPLLSKLLSGLFVKGNDFGLKGVLVEKILKPLTFIKQVLKPLIAKLGVPLVALVLINFEVLLVMWWMWEDCPRPYPVPAPQSVPYPPPPVPYSPPPIPYPAAPYRPAPAYHPAPPVHQPSYTPAPYYPDQAPNYSPEPYSPDPYFSRPQSHGSHNTYY